MNVLSLFDGISCGQLALKRAGIEYDNYYASEIDKHAIAITQHHFPNTIQLGNIVDIQGKDLPNIDLVIGGSPCQGFSFVGKQLNFNDPRSKLFFEFVRLLKECQPKWFLLENVKMKQSYQDIISKHVGVLPICINAALVSAARRNRLYWTNIPNITQPEDKGIVFDDINMCINNWIGQDRINMIANWNTYQKPLERAIRIGTRSKLPCLTAKGYNKWCSGMVLITDGNRYRYLVDNEAEQALNIPIGYTSICNSRRSRLLGNAWAVDVIAHIFRNIKGII